MIETLLFFALLFIIWIVAFKFVKSVFILKLIFKIGSIILLILFIVSATLGYYIVKDADEFRSKFTSSTNLFILHKDKHFISAIELTNASSGDVSDKFKILDKDMISKLEYNYTTGRLDYFAEHYYKVFFISIEAIEQRAEFKIQDQNFNLNKSEIIQTLLSDDAKKTVSEIIASRDGSSPSKVSSSLLANNEEIKGYLFADTMNYFFNPKNIDKFLSGLKIGNIEVYPETMMFKAIRFVPDLFIKNTIKDKALNNTIGTVLENNNKLT